MGAVGGICVRDSVIALPAAVGPGDSLRHRNGTAYARAHMTHPQRARESRMWAGTPRISSPLRHAYAPPRLKMSTGSAIRNLMGIYSIRVSI